MIYLYFILDLSWCGNLHDAGVSVFMYFSIALPASTARRMRTTKFVTSSVTTAKPARSWHAGAGMQELNVDLEHSTPSPFLSRISYPYCQIYSNIESVSQSASAAVLGCCNQPGT